MSLEKIDEYIEEKSQGEETKEGLSILSVTVLLEEWDYIPVTSHKLIVAYSISIAFASILF